MSSRKDVGWYVLVVILALRAFSQFFMAVFSPVYVSIFLVLMGFAYSTAIYGIYTGKKYGPWVGIGVALVDILSALVIGGASGFGAGVVDLLIIYLSYRILQKK